MTVEILPGEAPMNEFLPPRTMTPEELGDTLAHLVWESFTDFLAQGDAEIPLDELGIPTEEGVPNAHVTEEALIFIMWAHTRGALQAFLGRAPDELVRAGLDAMHTAVFEDMVKNGTPEIQMPLFEQRVSARYAEYHQASSQSDARVGLAVVRHLTGRDDPNEELARAVRDRAVAVAHPLKDFLEDVELIAA